MLNSSVGASGEWLSAGGKMASRESRADCCWGSFCGGTVHISFPQLLTPTEDCRNSVSCYWLIRLTCTLPVSQPEPFGESPYELMSHMFRWSPARSLTSYAWGKTHAMKFIVMAQSCLAVHTHFHCFHCCVPCVMEITVVILSLTNMLLIRPIIALFTRSLSLVQVPSGSKDPAGLFQRWKDGLGEAWWWRMSHPRFDDGGNGRVSRGPENPEKHGALHAPLRLDSECLSWCYQRGRREE